MMSHDQWLNSILEVARETASREFQQEAWLSGRPSTSSPTEIYNQLFDDYTFDLFFRIYSKTFSPDQMVAWAGFKQELERFEEKFREFPDDGTVFEDPDWHKVREAAVRFVAVFEEKHPKSSAAVQ